ncbi:MAG TPA: pantoate--beta-alanine ligase [Nitriliruptorales bacterium]
MRRVTRVAELRDAVRAARRADQVVGLVPTMGALHDGHLSLARHASAVSDVVVVSIFVNPLQFAPGEDLDTYPRDLDGDEAALASLGAAAPDLVFAPSVHEVYPRPVVTTVHVEGLTARLCGARRPGHFDGVTTVVSKLFNLVQPDRAFFGRKDFQQLQTIRRMVDDLDVPVEVVGLPTVREPDGLAMSSRNRYLDADARQAALALPAGLVEAVRTARAARTGGRRASVDALYAAATATLASESSLRIDYVEIVDPDTLMPPDQRGEDRVGSPDTAAETAAQTPEQLLVAVAAFVGPARLVDNVVVGDVADEDRLLEAVAGRATR